MKSFLFATAAIALAGCVSGTVQVPSACDQQSVSFPVASTLNSVLPSNIAALEPQGLTEVCSLTTAEQTALGLPATYQLPDQSTTTSFDFSSDLSKISQVSSNLQVVITSLLLDNPNNQFGFVSTLYVDITGQDTVSYPLTPLATYQQQVGTAPAELSVLVQITPTDLLRYLKSGPVVLTLTLHSNPVNLTEVCALLNQGTLTADAHMCVAGSDTFTKKL